MADYSPIIALLLLLFWLIDRVSQSGKIANLKKLLVDEQQQKDEISKQLVVAQAKISQLSKYEAIVDVEAEAASIRFFANSQAAAMVQDASQKAAQEIFAAKEEAKSIRADARQTKEKAVTYVQNQAQKADAVWKEANTRATELVKIAQQIIDDANVKAEEIGGDAYKALENTKELEHRAKAIKNIVEGYGNKYIKPTYSLLDDLAEEFGHMEAGEQLKVCRQRTHLMIEAGLAAKCDYVEAQRKETAILFVLDAFNGKVDSILSKVKKDNYGTLTQMIEDAFVLVNANGKAFRNAVITTEYKRARLDELKWAVVVQELKWQEQEEQRRIKEQIREEEKARRDFERALRDAQKEEETLKRWIEKAQKQVAEATETQKAEYELKLQALEGKLKEAEEKNQRALSMAQQTKSGNVYIISNIGSFGEDVFKVGMTRRLDPLDRIRELGDASVPFEFDVHAMIYCDDAPALERQLHKRFLRMQMNKVNPRKEFFKIGLTSIREEIEAQGIEVKWTMAAEAKQYKESLSIEEAIAKSGEEAKAWEEAQLKVDPVTIESEEGLDAGISLN